MFKSRRVIGLALALILIATTAALLLLRGGKELDSSDSNSPRAIANFSSVAELLERPDDIRALAWRKVNAYASNDYQSKMSVETYVSPNSLDCSAGLIEVAKNVEKYFQKTKIPKKLHIIIFNTDKDRKWAETTTGKLLTRKYRSYENGVEINPETVGENGEGVVWAEDPCNSSLDLSAEDKSRLSHGFGHVIQTLQFLGKEKDWARWGEIPRWILEGGATFVNNYVTRGETEENYLKRPESLEPLYLLGPNFFSDFIKYTPGEPNPWRHTDKWENYRAYDAGSYICEMMVALKGPESIMNLYGEYIKTNDFDIAFKNVFGTSWRDSYPIMSKAAYQVLVGSMKLNMPWAMPSKSPTA